MHRDANRWARAAVVALVSLPVVAVADRLTGGPVEAGPIQRPPWLRPWPPA